MLMNLFTIKIYLSVRLIKKDILVKNKFVVINTVIIGILLSSCKLSISPQLLSIEFIDDRTIEYEFSFVLGGNGVDNYFVQKFSITPDNGYEITQNTFIFPKGKIYFNKDIPDGAVVELDFQDFDRNYVLTHTFVKGEESESL